MGTFRSLLSLVLLSVVVLAGVLFGNDNSDAVSIGFFRWRSPEVSLFFWLVLAMVIGACVGFTLAGGLGVRRRLQARRMRRDLEASQQEVRDLRQIALED